MKTNYALHMAIACLLGGVTVAHEAMAVDWGTIATYASEEGTIADGQSIVISGGLAKIPLITGKNISNTASYYVKLTLKGGARFGSDVDNTNKLTCLYDGAAAGPEVIVQIPGMDKTEVTYQLNSGALGAAATCTLPSLSIKLYSGQKDYSIEAFVNYDKLNDVSTATNATTLVTFAQALSAKPEVVGSNASKVTVDVRTPSLGKGFVAADGIAANYTAIKAIGKVSYTNGSSIKKLDGNNAAPADFITKFSITVSGLPIAAGAEIAGQTRSGALFLGTDETCKTYFSAGTTVSFPLSVADVAVATAGTVTLDITTPANLNKLASTYPVVCMVANGVTSLPKGSVKVNVTTSQTPGKLPNTTMSSNDLSTFVKNGASVKVLNIPGASNATDTAFIRIYNMSDTEATVYGTLYNQGVTDAAGVDTDGGTILGTENMTLAKIPAKGMVVVSPLPANSSTVDLKALVGQDWSGKAWMQIESDVRQLRVQALIRTGGAGGVTVNSSDRVKAEGECVQRSDEDVCK